MEFKLSDKFLEQYRGQQPDWGFGDLSYFVYKRTYARTKDDGTQEEFWETCQRVVEGVFRIQKKHCLNVGLPWDGYRAQRSAQKMYEKMWSFKFLPPGRGLWVMGTSIIDRIGSAGLQNCGFASSANIKKDFGKPFAWTTDMLMLGVGTGHDTHGAGSLVVRKPQGEPVLFQIPDSREGWVEAIHKLISSYDGKDDRHPIDFDYSLIRPAGAPIRGFGGTASGPVPLKDGIESIRKVLDQLDGKPITSVAITDIMNLIGKFVVAGNTRRSAEIALGNITDKDFVEMKDFNKYPDELRNHRWASNNSVIAKPDSDFASIVNNIALNGEPGLVFLDNMRRYGRWKDGEYELSSSKADAGVVGVNPCLVGDTVVAVADGSESRTIKELAEEGKDIDVFCLDEKNRIVVRRMRNPRITGYNQPIYRVTLDSGDFFRVTGNHKFLLTNGRYVEAKDLKHDDSLWIMTKHLASLKDIFKDANSRSQDYVWLAQTGKKGMDCEHRVIARNHYGEIPDGYVIHHIDYDAQNNNPDNLAIMSKADHDALHAKDMIGDKNPMRRAKNEWTEERWRAYRAKHSANNSGSANPRFSGISSEDLYGHALALTRQHKRRISNKQWQNYAAEHGIPGQFSSYRIAMLGTPTDMLTRAAIEVGVICDADPRVLKTYNDMLEQNYETIIQDGKVFVQKECEICKHLFWIESVRREVACCSLQCGQLKGIKNRDMGRVREKQLATFECNRQDKQHQQLQALSDLRSKLGRMPLKKEWQTYCKKQSISTEMGRKGSPFRSWADICVAVENFNHKIVSVEFDGYEDVYNGTVDEFNNFFVGGFNGINRWGKLKRVYANTRQCGEQPLHDMELCNLVETFPNNHESADEYYDTLKYAYLYAKSVTLVPTHCPETNQVMLQNRRIGLSMSGIQQAIKKFGSARFFNDFCDKGYETVRHWDRVYSRWLGIPTSIRVTTVKPSGCQRKQTLINTRNGILRLSELGNINSNQQWQSIQYQTTSNRDITNFFQNGFGPTKIIRTEDGNELECSPHHRYRVWLDGVIVWKQADEIQVGDMLVNEIGDYQNEDEASLRSCDAPYHNCRDISFPDQMSPQLAWLLGLLYSDGSIHEKGLRISFNRKESSLVYTVVNVVRDLFGFEAKIDNDHSIYLNSTHLLAWLKQNGVLKEFCEKIEMPQAIRTSSAASILAFINGMWRGDGGFHNLPNNWSLCTTSKQMALDILATGRAIGLNLKISNAGPGGWGSLDRWILLHRNLAPRSPKALRARKIADNIWLDPVCEIQDSENFTYDVEVQHESHEYVANGVRSHNTVSLLAGATPGVHCTHSKHYMRSFRVAANSPLLPKLLKAGYRVEYAVTDKSKYESLKSTMENLPEWSDGMVVTEVDDVIRAFGSLGGTVIVYFPVKERNFTKSKFDISLWEQLTLVKILQEKWSDNSVSCTVTFNKDEAKDLQAAIEFFAPYVKTLSFLPLVDHNYPQAPYTECSEEEYNTYVAKLQPLDLSNSEEKSSGERYCTNDTCTI